MLFSYNLSKTTAFCYKLKNILTIITKILYTLCMENNISPKENENLESNNPKQNVWQFLKFLMFSLSAGIIQLGSFELMYHVIKWNNWWATYLISLVLSIVWNFTLNRKFTFKSASNVPLAMGLVLVYYCAFTPISVFGGNVLEASGWNGTLVTVLMMVINFVTEFFWDKFVVFNDKLTNKILHKTENK